MVAKPELRIAVAGLGTVGAATVRQLIEQRDLLSWRAGRPITVAAVSARDRRRDRGVDLSGVPWFDDPVAMARSAAADVVVELIGGANGAALAMAEAALSAGRSVVTANKAMLAHHGGHLAAMAEAAGLFLCFEAAVAGGIPIVKSLREGLAGNRLERVFGILNGTCNYILTRMAEDKREFADVLAEAQALGYAETDPSFDVDGIDTAHKLAILASVAFGMPLHFAGMHIEGIRHVSAVDIAYAWELGFRIKLLGIAQMTDRGVEQRVHPCMVPLSNPIAHVDGVFNAVIAQGDIVGSAFLHGRGAGAGPTASAVIADLVDIARDRRIPTFGRAVGDLQPVARLPMSEHRGPYYVRLKVMDRPGVVADIAAALRDEAVSMEALLQRGRDPGGAVPLVLTTHDAVEAAMIRALNRIERLDTVVEPPRLIRIIEGL